MADDFAVFHKKIAGGFVAFVRIHFERVVELFPAAFCYRAVFVGFDFRSDNVDKARFGCWESSLQIVRCLVQIFHCFVSSYFNSFACREF